MQRTQLLALQLMIWELPKRVQRRIFPAWCRIEMHLSLSLSHTLYKISEVGNLSPKADFGCFSLIQGWFWPFWSPAGTTWFWPNQSGSARIEAESARIRAEWHESKKKNKNSDTAPTRRQLRRWPHPSSDSGAAPSQPRQCFTDRNWINMNAHSHNTLITNKKGWPSIE